ncbi:MAG: tRNA (N(6)-L-threonylcarbamoyladenosine(37)-C(2))-methylthiotransferase MtaB [candidate division Zixibacteria bacterium]|nr:tRNA (N(6)-L-threonylcarbamoyladenosine(37)-C(2))-methylthiotransferase MtaB [candidate division Zixibacteria bacterium]
MSTRAHKTVRLKTVGCRLNQYETEKIGASLFACGFHRAAPYEPVDLTLINTCTVTHRADSDCRYLIRRAHRDNPAGYIVVVGCYVEHERERLAAMDGVNALIDNSEKDNIISILQKRLPDLFAGISEKGDDAAAPETHHRNRAWIKISDGCNQKCTFCLVTKVRGPLVNRQADEIVDEIGGVAGQGFREIVLTGVNIGYYRDRNRKPMVGDLASLCRLIIDHSDSVRLRLSSIEPQAVTDDLLTLLANSDGRMCRHLHLPLQSGSDRILKLMRRPYNEAKFIDRVSAIRQASPSTLIGADVIVGFPGETEEDFDRTRNLCESGMIDYLHVFSYSDRPGTVAVELPDKVKPETIRNRSLVLSEISDRNLARARQRHTGRILEVISEHKAGGDGNHFAVSDNYLRVKLPPGVETGRELVRVKIRDVREDYLECDLI